MAASSIHDPLTRPAAPWTEARGLEPVVRRWLDSNVVRPCIVAEKEQRERDGEYAPLPGELPDGLRRALAARGAPELYSHQARAFRAAHAGKHLVVATPTASGKSFCFHLPVLERLARDPDARALYLFPTKALARDQEASLRELAKEAGMATPAIVYDGDTPADARRTAREKTGIVLTNPDMLHTGILPHHTAWARTFQNLAFVVVDELHTYKGVFGSHVANVLRRLRRVAEFHGSRPVFIGATATIGNPREHAARLFGIDPEEAELVAQSGAPTGSRKVFLYNPPVVNAELGVRASYVKQAVMLAADLVRARVPTIVFGHSRNNIEVMLRYLRDRVSEHTSPDVIMGYRGGYLPEKRREIERKLRAGEILCVVATNALELGIDVGALDAVVCAGYPGSVAATYQRFGRAGRRGAESICVLVTSSAPLDQYIAREPGFLFGAPVEEARIDPDNVEILVQHLKCAAFELPFKRAEAPAAPGPKRAESFGSLGEVETAEALEFLVHHRVLHESGGTYHWAADAYPANEVSLRSVGWDNVVIIDAENDKTLAEIDWRGAHTMVHEQAIYQHDGECWQVERFDYENHKAFVRKVEPDYYTDAMTYTQVSVIEDAATGPAAPHARGAAWTAGHGEVAVVEKVVGYKKIKFYTHENTGYGDVRLPEMQMHTTAFWLTVPEERLLAVPAGRAAAIDALRGIGIALEIVATFALMCDPRDLGTTLGDADVDPDEDGAKAPPQKVRGGARPGYSPTLFLYEHTPGGIGLASRIYEDRATLLARAARLIAGCDCEHGCPACTGPAEPFAFGAPAGEPARTTSRKALALELLADLAASGGG
jgi:DEAD/DEAH box helicase domain-containing protein